MTKSGLWNEHGARGNLPLPSLQMGRNGYWFGCDREARPPHLYLCQLASPSKPLIHSAVHINRDWNNRPGHSEAQGSKSWSGSHKTRVSNGKKKILRICIRTTSALKIIWLEHLLRFVWIWSSTICMHTDIYPLVILDDHSQQTRDIDPMLL